MFVTVIFSCIDVLRIGLKRPHLVSTVGKEKKPGGKEVLLRKFCDFEGKSVILRGKMKKNIREICYAGRKILTDCREINIFPGLLVSYFL